MKKAMIAAMVLLMTAGSLCAQNNFRGIVKFKLESSGKVDVQIKPENSTFEIKVFDNKLMIGTTIQNGFKTITKKKLYYSDGEDAIYMVRCIL